MSQSVEQLLPEQEIRFEGGSRQRVHAGTFTRGRCQDVKKSNFQAKFSFFLGEFTICSSFDASVASVEKVRA